MTDRAHSPLCEFGLHPIELPDLESAKREVVERIRRLLNREAVMGHMNLDRRVEISDCDGNLLAVVHFRDVTSLSATQSLN